MTDNRSGRWRGGELRRMTLVALVVLVCLALGGCADADAVGLRLHAQAPRGGDGTPSYEIQVQVTGVPTGLEYRWFSVAGECQPEVTIHPRTLFTFAEGTSRDRVSVEAWRDGRPVGQAQLDVDFGEELLARRVHDASLNVGITITQVPPWDSGGDHTRADIAGSVTGDVESDWQVVIYARAYESWFVQPIAHTLLPIREDRTWGSWTHMGESYAALLVKPGYVPLPRLDVLPHPGGLVMARTVVEGQRNE